MGVAFDIKYDKCNKLLSVLQNGSQTGAYSQFSRCNNQPFEKWFDLLANYCVAEANSVFSVSFSGGELYSLILKKHFQNLSLCSNYKYKKDIIMDCDRVRWLDTLCKSINAPSIDVLISSTIDITSLPNVNLVAFRNNDFQFTDMKHIPIFFNKIASRNADVTIVNSYTDYENLDLKPNKPSLMIIADTQKLEFCEYKNKLFVFRCSKDSILSLIRTWMYDFILPSYYTTVSRLVLSGTNRNSIGNSTLLAKILVASKPYISLKIIDKVELSKPIHFDFIKYPEDLKCTISVSNLSVARLSKDNGRFVLQPLSEGSTEVIARVGEMPDIFVSEKVQIYKYVKVSSITITLPSRQIVIGDSFDLIVKLHPLNAHNQNHKKWSVSPNSIVSISPDGHCKALSSGTCSISLKIGDVSSTVSLKVYEMPAGVKFDHNSISVKLGDNSQSVHHSIIPVNSAKANVKFKVSDPKILSYDSNNGQIITKSEGNTVIAALLIDGNGVVISDAKCFVTVKPQKDVITPSLFSTIQFLLLVSFVFLFGFTWIRNICGIFFIIMSILSIIAKRNMLSIIFSIISVILIIIMLFGG